MQSFYFFYVKGKLNKALFLHFLPKTFLNCCTFFETILKLTARIQVTWASSEVVAEVTIWLKCWGCWRISRQFKATAAGIVKGRGRQIAYNTNKHNTNITSTLGLFWFLLVCFNVHLMYLSFFNFFYFIWRLPPKRCLTIISLSLKRFWFCSKFDYKVVRPFTSLVQAV